MTTNEMTKRIEELENKRFFLAMKDRWSRDDYDTDRKWFEEILDLKKKITENA